MNAMIFAAGLGTRLLPLTRDIPKALVPLGGKPLLLHVIDKLAASGIHRIVINVHHHPDAIRRFVSSLHYPGIRFHISDESFRLLDTGGGLKKAASFLRNQQPVILHNADVLSDISLKDMLRVHRQNDALATLAVSRRSTTRYLLWHNEQLAGWENERTGEAVYCRDLPGEKLTRLAFSGVQIISPELFDLLLPEDRFSIIKLYLELAKTQSVCCYEHDGQYWADIGSPGKLQKANTLYLRHKKKFDSFV